jgi:hypothetical protein
MGMTEAEAISTFSAFRMALQRLRTEVRDLFRDAEIVFPRMGENGGGLIVQEEPAVYRGKERKKKAKRTRTK